jgi:hypothetical protein
VLIRYVIRQVKVAHTPSPRNVGLGNVRTPAFAFFQALHRLYISLGKEGCGGRTLIIIGLAIAAVGLLWPYLTWSILEPVGVRRPN